MSVESEREPTDSTPDEGVRAQHRPEGTLDGQTDPMAPPDPDAAELSTGPDLDAFGTPPGYEDADPEDPDALGGAAPGNGTALPPKLEAWRRRSAAGAILTGFALGLQEALETRKEEPSIVMETSGEPPKDLPVEAEFEYGRPRQSVVQIRPWLLPDTAGEAAGAPDGPEAREDGSADDGRPPTPSGGR